MFLLLRSNFAEIPIKILYLLLNKFHNNENQYFFMNITPISIHYYLSDIINMLINLLFLFFISLFLSIVFIFITKKIFIKLNILDNPKKYGHSRDPIPHSM